MAGLALQRAQEHEAKCRQGMKDMVLHHALQGSHFSPSEAKAFTDLVIERLEKSGAITSMAEAMREVDRLQHPEVADVTGVISG